MSPKISSPDWHSALVLICEKCGKKLNAEGRLALDLKDQVKKRLISRGKWGPVRVVTSSCLDLCPEGAIAVAFTGDSGQASEIVALDPLNLAEWVFQKIDARLQSS